MASRTTEGVDKAKITELPAPQANVVPESYTKRFKVRTAALSSRQSRRVQFPPETGQARLQVRRVRRLCLTISER